MRESIGQKNWPLKANSGSKATPFALKSTQNLEPDDTWYYETFLRWYGIGAIGIENLMAGVN